MPDRPMRVLDRLVRLLLLAAPADFRRAHDNEIGNAIGDVVRALFAAWLPARRAMLVDPVSLLREE